MSYLATRTKQEATYQLSSDYKELLFAAKKLANHAIKLGSLGIGVSFLEWIASFAAMYAHFLFLSVSFVHNFIPRFFSMLN